MSRISSTDGGQGGGKSFWWSEIGANNRLTYIHSERPKQA